MSTSGKEVSDSFLTCTEPEPGLSSLLVTNVTGSHRNWRVVLRLVFASVNQEALVKDVYLCHQQLLTRMLNGEFDTQFE